jgi:hypothetical protein
MGEAALQVVNMKKNLDLVPETESDEHSLQ